MEKAITTNISEERLLTDTMHKHKSLSDVKLNWENPKYYNIHNTIIFNDSFYGNETSIENILRYTHDVKSAQCVSETQ